ncbi:MAG: DUF2835 domain-containing protein [Gammaproteobacteria bacterium]
MPRLFVTLSIDSDAYLRHYRGSAKDVAARTDDGRSVRFPANILRNVVTRDGIHGRFCIEFDQRGKFVSIERA